MLVMVHANAIGSLKSITRCMPLVTSGAETAADIRGVFDVLNMGQLLNLSQEQVGILSCTYRTLHHSLVCDMFGTFTGKVGDIQEL